MNSFDPSKLTLLKRDNLLGFLGANGWEKYSSQPFSSVWVKGNYEVLIPEEDVRDFRPRLFEALKEISLERDVSIEAVFRQILMSGFETLKVSSVGPKSNNGTVSFKDGASLVSNIRDMLIASANAAIEPRRFYSGKRSELAESFLREARFGQTEHGSFVFTVLAPVMKSDEEYLEGFEPELPYGSKVVKTLLEATSKAANAAKLAFDDSDWFRKQFIPLVSQGVSANLCSAISGLLDIEGAEKTILTVTSNSGCYFENNRVEIPAALSERFSQAATEFRKDPPLKDVFIHGKTISFRRADIKNIGKISIKAEIGGEIRSVSLSLSSEIYSQVLDAHKYDCPIEFTADLKKSTGHYDATNIRNLNVLKVGDFFPKDEI